MDQKTVDMLDLMGLDSAEIKAAVEQSKADRKGDPRVCICGHGARNHSSHARSDNFLHESYRNSGIDKCMPNRQDCPCDGFRAVVKAQDVRMFKFRTDDSYAKHALSKGIMEAQERGKTVEPIIDWRCDFCDRTDSVGPVSVNKFGKEAHGPGIKNFLMCPEHVRLLRVGSLFSRQIDPSSPPE